MAAGCTTLKYMKNRIECACCVKRKEEIRRLFYVPREYQRFSAHPIFVIVALAVISASGCKKAMEFPGIMKNSTMPCST
jgi:hypothetical protein